ncbi:uncharacterized protein EI90DRAFT_3014667 [Cantharellus anzutake]|uniref:uncharacterized protein n=1 Tax=Cantharellus anzutake TaxID=1750568 RepID=UPI001907D0FA|nr:uncharacterized protein EI90DRAFT_3014667 [Cantharellus anzutake]KAF8335419.1 hypothetical protein EI90DRAFT_3014667 [Cantharellus anzutake]
MSAYWRSPYYILVRVSTQNSGKRLVHYANLLVWRVRRLMRWGWGERRFNLKDLDSQAHDSLILGEVSGSVKKRNKEARPVVMQVQCQAVRLGGGRAIQDQLLWLWENGYWRFIPSYQIELRRRSKPLGMAALGVEEHVQEQYGESGSRIKIKERRVVGIGPDRSDKRGSVESVRDIG